MNALVPCTLYATALGNAIVVGGPVRVDLSLYRGDSAEIVFEVTSDEGAPVYISAATFLCQIRPKADQSIIGATFSVQPIAGEASKAKLVIDAATSDTINFTDGVWDLQMTLDGNVSTLFAGNCTITQDVSHP